MIDLHLGNIAHTIADAASHAAHVITDGIAGPGHKIARLLTEKGVEKPINHERCGTAIHSFVANGKGETQSIMENPEFRMALINKILFSPQGETRIAIAMNGKETGELKQIEHPQPLKNCTPNSASRLLPTQQQVR